MLDTVGHRARSLKEERVRGSDPRVTDQKTCISLYKRTGDHIHAHLKGHDAILRYNIWPDLFSLIEGRGRRSLMPVQVKPDYRRHRGMFRRDMAVAEAQGFAADWGSRGGVILPEKQAENIGSHCVVWQGYMFFPQSPAGNTKKSRGRSDKRTALKHYLKELNDFTRISEQYHATTNDY